MKSILVALLIAACTFAVSAQELKLPVLSPTSTITQEFSTSKMEITYSRPSARGRAVFGEVVGWGEVWRTGANAATKITFGEDVSIGGKAVKAGTYALYSIPNKSQWEIILNKGVGNWGTGGYSTADDVARFTVPAQSLPSNVETFTISIGDITFNSCTINLSWERVLVSIPVKAENEARLNASIDKAINNPTIPYQQAATYYLETNQNLDKALTYADKAIEANPKAFWLQFMKAKIAAKLGRKDVATAAANASIQLAKGTPYEAEYTRNNQKLLESLK
ncbi:MAG: DUF2911 domain-containing protein [Candidatus Kapabacteria bacterium]|jgi:hypothetical protein|nr:DUF2911 domain-containing protein [Candidatus Kapabacteria bacterium]